MASWEPSFTSNRDAEPGRQIPGRKEIMMTREEKIEWLANATAEQVVDQMFWAVSAMSTGNIETRVQANEDYSLVKAELLKRLG